MKLQNLKQFFEMRQNCPFCGASLNLSSPLGLKLKVNNDTLSIYYDYTINVSSVIINEYYKSISVNMINNKVNFIRRYGVFKEEDRHASLLTNIINLEHNCNICGHFYNKVATLKLSSEEIKNVAPVLVHESFVYDGYPIYLNYQNDRTYIYGLSRKTFDGIIFDLKEIDLINDKLETIKLFG